MPKRVDRNPQFQCLFFFLLIYLLLAALGLHCCGVFSLVVVAGLSLQWLLLLQLPGSRAEVQ